MIILPVIKNILFKIFFVLIVNIIHKITDIITN
jgi:hypothetical protein